MQRQGRTAGASRRSAPAFGRLGAGMVGQERRTVKGSPFSVCVTRVARSQRTPGGSRRRVGFPGILQRKRVSADGGCCISLALPLLQPAIQHAPPPRHDAYVVPALPSMSQEANRNAAGCEMVLSARGWRRCCA